LHINRLANHQERFHLIFLFRRVSIDVDDGCISASLDTAMLLNRLEDSPTVITVTFITSESESNEDRFNGFWSVHAIVLTSGGGGNARDYWMVDIPENITSIIYGLRSQNVNNNDGRPVTPCLPGASGLHKSQRCHNWYS